MTALSGAVGDEDNDIVCSEDESSTAFELHGLFWMSPNQVQQARRYRAVLIHDNTYGSNSRGMKLGLFTSINMHGHTVLLGQCLIATETYDDYVWQFNTYLEASSATPMVVFTDRDPALEQALNDALPELTTHLWCIWHIGQNLKKNTKLNAELQAMNKDSQEFGSQFYNLNKCVGKHNFRNLWNEFLATYPGYPAEYMQESLGGDLMKRWAMPWQVSCL